MQVAFADVSQRPVHRLAYEIARVASVRVYEWKPGNDRVVRLILQMHGCAGNHRKGSSPNELAIVGCDQV